MARRGFSRCCMLLLGAVAGCSALTDFDVRSFAPDERDDGGASGSSGAGDSGAADAGGAGAGGGGELDAGPQVGGDGGLPDGVGAECAGDAECRADLVCVAGRCARRRPAGRWVTSGGGTVSSEHYRGRIGVGAPVPIGVAKSERYRITVGPVGGNP